MADYRVLVADLVGNAIREEIVVHDLEWSVVLDAPGALSGWVHMDDPKCTRTNLDPGATLIYLERGGLLVWGGILWTAQARSSDRHLAIGAEGFWSYFRRRLIRATQTYTGQDQLFIARDLINYAQAQGGGNIGITVGSETSGVTRDRTYPQSDRKNLGEAIEQLAAVLNGFDFEITVAWDTTGTIPQRTFKLYYPRRGARIDGLVFDHEIKGTSDLEVDVTAKEAANQVDALGSGDGDAMLISTASDTTLFARYPLLEDAVDFRDVNVKATLDGHAAASLGRKKRPIELPSLTLPASTSPALGSYQVGDEGIVTITDGWIDTTAYYRVQEYTVKVTDDGNEFISPTVVSADAQVY